MKGVTEYDIKIWNLFCAFNFIIVSLKLSNQVSRFSIIFSGNLFRILVGHQGISVNFLNHACIPFEIALTKIGCFPLNVNNSDSPIMWVSVIILYFRSIS